MQKITAAITDLEKLQADPAAAHVNNQRALLRLRQALELLKERDADLARIAADQAKGDKTTSPER